MRARFKAFEVHAVETRDLERAHAVRFFRQGVDADLEELELA